MKTIRNSKFIPAAVVLTALGIGSAGAVLARDNDRERHDQREAASLLSAKTSLTQAIAAAESQTQGKALDAGLENEDGSMRYEVRIVKDDATQLVLVAPDTGKVIKVMPADDGDDHGHAGERESHDKD